MQIRDDDAQRSRLRQRVDGVLRPGRVSVHQGESARLGAILSR